MRIAPFFAAALMLTSGADAFQKDASSKEQALVISGNQIIKDMSLDKPDNTLRIEIDYTQNGVQKSKTIDPSPKSAMFSMENILSVVKPELAKSDYPDGEFHVIVGRASVPKSVQTSKGSIGLFLSSPSITGLYLSFSKKNGVVSFEGAVQGSCSRNSVTKQGSCFVGNPLSRM